MSESVLAQLAALPGKSTVELKALWVELYDREPPSFNRDYLVKRLAYRIQELAYSGLSARAEAKLDRLNQDVVRVMASPEMKELLASLGAEAWTLAPAAFDDYIRQELAANASIVKAAGIKPN